jgi:hypothetical protein
MARANNSLKRFLLATLAMTFVTLGTGCQGRYRFSRVSDYVLFDGQLYVLVVREEGIDRAPRFAHSAAFRPTRRVLCIARSSIDETNQSFLHVVARREITDSHFLHANSFVLCSTNVCAVKQEGATELVLMNESAATPRRLFANRTAFTSNRKYLVGCGKSNWVFETKSLVSKSAERLNRLCDLWPDAPHTRVAVSDDLHTAVIQTAFADPPTMAILNLDERREATHVVLPDIAYQLQGVYGSGEETRILFMTRLPADGPSAFILDSGGNETARGELPGIPVADAQCTTVLAVPFGQAMTLNQNERLVVNVWMPDQNRTFFLSLDTSSIWKDH